jgi:hypothetical protein
LDRAGEVIPRLEFDGFSDGTVIERRLEERGIRVQFVEEGVSGEGDASGRDDRFRDGPRILRVDGAYSKKRKRRQVG